MSIVYQRSGNILCILNVLKKYSDSNNILSISQIKELVKKEYGYVIEDRTIRRDINLLIEQFNYDISTYNINKKGYFLNKDAEFDFEKGEIRVILDIFNYSPMIAKWISDKTMAKIKNMQSDFDNKELDDYIAYSKNNKTSNSDVIVNIEDISLAIANKQKIKFEYHKYDLDKELHFHKKHVVSPYAVVYEEQSFYLIAINEGERNLRLYRLDKIKKLECLEESIVIDKTKEEISEFVTSMIYAFGGEKEKIKLLCSNYLIDPVIDKFGRDVKIKKYDKDHFILETEKNIYGIKWWLKYNMEACVVLEPESLREEMKEIFNKSLDKYKEVTYD